MKSLGICILTYLIFIFNILVFVFHTVLVTFGIYAAIFITRLTNIAAYDVAYQFVRQIVITHIVGGAIICVTSSMACWGAVSQNPHILVTSAILEFIVVSVNTGTFIRMEIEDYVDPFGGPILAIIVGTLAAVDIVGIVLTSFMASLIHAERRRNQIQQLV